jgi:hypothetical protein
MIRTRSHTRVGATGTLLLAVIGATACHDPDEPPEPTPAIQVSEHVLESMRRGGRVRPVVYAPPTSLAFPDTAEIELPFPGPGTDGPGPEAVEEEQDDDVPPPPAAPPSPPPDTTARDNMPGG